MRPRKCAAVPVRRMNMRVVTNATRTRLRTLADSPFTSSTTWHEPMRQDPRIAALRSEERPQEQLSAEHTHQNRHFEIAQASRTLLADLAASLEAGQQDLMARDVARVEQHTLEQIGLHRALAILWSPAPPARGCMKFDFGLDSELCAGAIRVLQLGRVQAAMLKRQQRRLRMISSLAAGSGATYSPPAASGVTHDPGQDSSNRRDQSHARKEGRDQCPA